MNPFSKRKDKNLIPTMGALTGVSTMLTGSQADSIINPDNAQVCISLESADTSNTDTINDNIKDVIDELQLNPDEVNVAMESACVATAALGNPQAYREAATIIPNHDSSVKVMDDGNGVPSFESYDESAIGNYQAQTIVYNMLAPHQDRFGETLYPTKIVTPEQGGIAVTVDLGVVQRSVKRSLAGTKADFGRRNILDAYADPSIMDSANALRMVPFKNPDNSNDKYFVAGVNLPDQVIDGVAVPTGVLGFGTVPDYIGLCSGAGNLGGQALDGTDAIEPGAGLKTIIIKVTDQANTQTSYIPVDVQGLPRAGFISTGEGGSRETSLSFKTAALPLKKTTANIAGTVAPALDSLSDTQAIVLDLTVAGTLDLEKGGLTLMGGTPAINSLWDNKDEVSITTGTGLALVNNLTFEAVGVVLDTEYSNANLRHRPLIVESVSRTEFYPIGFTAPITALRPAYTRNSRGADELRAAIEAQRAANSINAVNSLIRRAAQLSLYADALHNSHALPLVEGAGRLLIKPYYVYREIDLLTHVQGTKSHERAADVSDAIVNAIRAEAYPMAADSNYGTVLDLVSGGSEKPRLIIATDAVLEEHVIVHGDRRTASIAFEHSVVSSPNAEMEGKMFLTFSRNNGSDVTGLDFGVHGWTPEMVSKGVVSVGGSTSDCTVVQPRSRHINILPLLVELKFTNLKEALTPVAP